MTSREKVTQFQKRLSQLMAAEIVETEITPTEMIGAWEEISYCYKHKLAHKKEKSDAE